MALSKKKILRLVILLVGIAVLSTLIISGINLYKKFKSPKSNIVSAIPQTAALIFEFNKPLDLKQKLFSKTALWNELVNIEPFMSLNQQIAYADSLIRHNNQLQSLFENAPLYISVHPSGNNYGQFLFYTEISAGRKTNYLEKIFKDIFKDDVVLEKSEFKGVDILSLKNKIKNTATYFTIYKGVVVSGLSKTLVEDAILRLKEQTPIGYPESFEKVSATLGKKVDGNIYIHYENFYRLILPLLSNDYKNGISFLRTFANWSGLDINIKNESVIFNGFTEVPETENSYLNLFVNQQPQKIDVIQILPYNTSSFIFLGFSDFGDFKTMHKKQLENKGTLDDYNNEINNFSSALGFDIEKQIISNISSEMTYATISNQDTKESHDYFIVKFDDEDILRNLFNLLQDQKNLPSARSIDFSSYRNYDFGYIDYPDFFNLVFGTSFNISPLNVFCIIENYLVLGASRNNLTDIINALLFKRNLSNSEHYNTFSNLLSSRANMHIFYNVSQSLNSFKSFFTNDISGKIDVNNPHFQFFDAFAVQVSRSDNKFYKNICFNYNPEPAADISYSLWETELDFPAGEILDKVVNHNDNSVEIIINDINNNLYLIDKNGLIVWKRKFDSPILSNIHQIDFYKNGKLQYLFNTANNIYLIDRNGEDVGNYPVKLTHKASNGLNVFDYDNNKNYRIFICTEKNEVLNLDKEGKTVKGWKTFKTQSPTNEPVRFIRLLGKDFIMVNDDDGRFYILDRRGDVRIKPDKPFKISSNNVFYPLITPDKKGKFVTTDINGKITTIDFNGKTEQIHLDNFSENHYFIFEDLNNNSLKEYIFVDSNNVFFYDYSKNLIKILELSSPIENRPSIFNNNNKYRLGFFAKSSSMLYLTNNEFEIIEGFPIQGTSPFIVIETKDESKNHIIAANEKIVFKIFLE